MNLPAMNYSRAIFFQHLVHKLQKLINHVIMQDKILFRYSKCLKYKLLRSKFLWIRTSDTFVCLKSKLFGNQTVLSVWNQYLLRFQTRSVMRIDNWFNIFFGLPSKLLFETTAERQNPNVFQFRTDHFSSVLKPFGFWTVLNQTSQLGR